jgi:hypothetical protein
MVGFTAEFEFRNVGHKLLNMVRDAEDTKALEPGQP